LDRKQQATTAPSSSSQDDVTNADICHLTVELQAALDLLQGKEEATTTTLEEGGGGGGKKRPKEQQQ